VAAGLRSGLHSQNKFPVEIYSEHLDLLRFVDAPHQDNLSAYLRAKYAGRRIDLIVVISSSAFNFIMERGEAIFPGVPIVFTSVGITRIEKSALNRTVTGVAVKRDYGDTIDVILRLQPDITEIVIPVGATSLEKAWTMDIQEHWMISSMSQFQRRFADAMRESAYLLQAPDYLSIANPFVNPEKNEATADARATRNDSG